MPALDHPRPERPANPIVLDDSELNMVQQGIAQLLAEYLAHNGNNPDYFEYLVAVGRKLGMEL